MRDSTGKWVSAADLISILQQLPPSSRIYPNRLQQLNVTNKAGDEWLGMIDFNHGCYQSLGEEEEPNHAPTDWCWDPLPAISGWFAVIRGWEPEEGMFPGAAWVEAGQVRPPHDNGVARDGSGHAGPFATEAEALEWAEAHDPEDPSWRGSHA